jgi:phosphatidylinositol 3-kinase
VENNSLFLFLDLPVYDFPLVYDERRYLNPFPVCSYANDASIIRVTDLDMFRENPVENKHRKMVRSQRNGAIDRDLKPNSKIRDDLKVRFNL